MDDDDIFGNLADEGAENPSEALVSTDLGDDSDPLLQESTDQGTDEQADAYTQKMSGLKLVFMCIGAAVLLFVLYMGISYIRSHTSSDNSQGGSSTVVTRAVTQPTKQSESKAPVAEVTPIVEPNSGQSSTPNTSSAVPLLSEINLDGFEFQKTKTDILMTVTGRKTYLYNLGGLQITYVLLGTLAGYDGTYLVQVPADMFGQFTPGDMFGVTADLLSDGSTFVVANVRY